MLHIENLFVTYNDRPVLYNVTLDVAASEVLALIGPNGAGKSTLIRAVSGFIPIVRGNVHIENTDLLALQANERAKRLAVVPQAASLPAAFSVWEIVLFGRTPYLNFLGQTSPKDDEIARRALTRVDALDLADRRVGELSGGEQQRVLLARALAQATPILLLDEPTSHLDLHHQIEFLELVSQLAHEDKMAVLVALHDLNLVGRYADNVALMVDGRIKAVGAPSDVLRTDLLSEAYDWPVQVVPHPLYNGPLVLPEPPKHKTA